MIKVGIYGSADIHSPLRKQLLRLLLRHPDVELCSVAAPEAKEIALTELYPVYTGETDLHLVAKPELTGIDVLFVIDEVNLTQEIEEELNANESIKLIVLGEAPNLRRQQPEDMVYGFAEYNRKALVRGAVKAVSPSPVALLLETALFPLAKSWHLPDVTIEGTIALPFELSEEVEEAETLLKSIQSTFSAPIKLKKLEKAPYQRLDLQLSLTTTLPLHQVRELYENAYEDHGFTYIIPGHSGVDEDLRGSNKCLLQLFEEDGHLRINASADLLTRSNAGNAVHLMNLLFGLQERTGLSI